MMQWISWVVLGILIIALIINHFDWRQVAVDWVGNNPEHAQVYIKAGDTVRTVEGVRFYVGGAGEGQLYLYRLGKLNYVVGVGDNYPYDYIRGRRVIGVNDGKLAPNPLGWYDPAANSIKEGQAEFSALVLGNVVAKSLASVKPSRVFQWTTILLIIAGIIVAVYWWQSTHSAAPAATQPPPAAQQQQQQQQQGQQGQGVIPLNPGQVIP